MPISDDQCSIRVGGRVHQFTERESGKPFSAFQFSLRAWQVPAALAYLKQQNVDPSYVIFSTGNHQPENRAINLQYAMVEGILGLEWVRLMPKNIADWKRVTRYIRQHGHVVQERELNGVRFLRVEDGDLPELGLQLLHDLYGVQPDVELGLFVGRITWSPEWQATN